MNNQKYSDYKKYKSKIGLPVYLTYLLFIGFYLIIWLVPPFILKSVLPLKIASTVILSIYLIFQSVIFFNTYYIIADDHVLIVFGFIKRKIFFDQINEVKVTKSLLNLNSFALSLKKINLITGIGLFKRVQISPKEEQEFLDELIPLLRNTEM